MFLKMTHSLTYQNNIKYINHLHALFVGQLEMTS